MSERLNDPLGSGIVLGLGIAGLALGGVIKWLSRRKYEIVLKKAAHCYNDYNKLRNDLLQSNGALSNIIIEGDVNQSSRCVEYVSEKKHQKGVAQLNIVKTKDKKHDTLEIASVPFTLVDSDGNAVTIENIHTSQGYYSLCDSGVLQQVATDLRTGNIVPTSQEERKVHLIKYGTSLAVLGDVMFREGKGGEIVFNPNKVGKSVELLISTKKTTNLSTITTRVLVIGGVTLIVIVGIIWIWPWIRGRIQSIRRPIAERGSLTNTWYGEDRAINYRKSNQEGKDNQEHGPEEEDN